MSLDALRAQLPDYAKDLRLNLESVLSEAGAQGLEPRQARAVALASAIASRHRPPVEAMEAAAADLLTAAEIPRLRAGAAVQAQTQGDYRFPPPRPLAVSAINGCGACMDSHEQVLRQHGVGAQGVQSTVRIAAVVHASAVTLEQA